LRVVAVGSREVLLGLMLAGVKDVVETGDPDEAVERIRAFLKDEDVGAIIVASEIYDAKQDELERIRGDRTLPLFARFPAKGVEFR